MTKNATKIANGLRALTTRQWEITSGTVVAGSVDESGGTFSVVPTDTSAPITGNSNGLIVFPADNSHVVIGTVDGPGIWSLLKASELAKVTVTIAHVALTIDNNQINVQNGSVVLNAGSDVFKLNTTNESLYQFLNDLITAITALTVGTGSGPSTIPVNVASFNSLLTRLPNLLTA